MKAIRNYTKVILTIFCLLTIYYSKGGYADMKIYAFIDENGRKCIDITVSKTTITPEVAKEIAEVLRKKSKPLKNLIFQTVSFEPGTFTTIVEALRSHLTLEYLYLVGNTYADSDFWEKLIDVLQTIKTLTFFETQDNSLDSNNIKRLADILKYNSSLTKLNLSGNKIDNAGAKELAELLRINRSLVTLDLGYNRIDAEGTQAIAEALRTNRTLVTLYLEGNAIDVAGLRALLNSMAHNTTIEYIGSGNWSLIQRQVLSEAYGRNKLLKSIVDKIREIMASKNIAYEGEDVVFNFIINSTDKQFEGLSEDELTTVDHIKAYQRDFEQGIKAVMSSPGPNTGSPEKAIAAAPSSAAIEARPLKRQRVAYQEGQPATEIVTEVPPQVNLTTMEKPLHEESPQAPWPTPSIFSK